jgi:adenosylcobinamide hydrolase
MMSEEQRRIEALRAPSIPGVYVKLLGTGSSTDEHPCLIVQAEVPLYALSSAVVGGGFADVIAVVNRQVPKSYLADDPEAEMRAFLADLGLGAGALGLMTAAFVREVGFAEHGIGEDGRVAATWATVGLGNAARAGRVRVPAGGLFPGTINVITVIDGDLEPAAYVGAAVVAAEAKAAALLALGVRDADDGGVATGTTTDAVVIAATRRGRPVRYAGTATVVGHAVARTVYDAVLESGRRYLDYVASRATGL